MKTFKNYLQEKENKLNEGQESLKDLLSDESAEIQKLASEIEKMLEPQRNKIGVAYYDKVMQNIAAIVKLK
jgi:hypothetical protein